MKSWRAIGTPDYTTIAGPWPIVPLCNCLIWPHLFCIIAAGALITLVSHTNADVGLIKKAQNVYIHTPGTRNYVPRSEINPGRGLEVVQQPLRSLSSNRRQDAKFSLQAPFKLDKHEAKALDFTNAVYCFTDRPVL